LGPLWGIYQHTQLIYSTIKKNRRVLGEHPAQSPRPNCVHRTSGTNQPYIRSLVLPTDSGCRLPNKFINKKKDISKNPFDWFCQFGEFEDIFKEIHYIKNRIRSHIRKNYRIEYEKMKSK